MNESQVRTTNLQRKHSEENEIKKQKQLIVYKINKSKYKELLMIATWNRGKQSKL